MLARSFSEREFTMSNAVETSPDRKMGGKRINRAVETGCFRSQSSQSRCIDGIDRFGS